MKLLLCIIFSVISSALAGQDINSAAQATDHVSEADNNIFTGDNFWRGADGAASIDLGNGRVLWLFSDTFINPDGKPTREKSKMINNSLAIQSGYDPDTSRITFYFRGCAGRPKSFFEIPGKTWFWTGHGILVDGKLIIFLFEEARTKEGLGFTAKGWYVAIIDNPEDSPADWKIKYVRGPKTFGIIVGSSAVLKDEKYIYAYGVKEPGTHEVYLLRFDLSWVLEGNIDDFDWWVNDSWCRNVTGEPKGSSLFTGQTEFSVTYDKENQKYIQIQTYGWGQASIGYRTADRPQGPWSNPVIFYTPKLNDGQDFVYTARAHPELNSDGLLITYNINNFDFGKLIRNEDIYFPKFIKLKHPINK